MAEKLPPSSKASNGRDQDSRGRFLPGHKLSKGNPYARKIAKLRAALLAAISEADIRKVAKQLVKAATGGDVAAARELFNRVLGHPLTADLDERLANLETLENERIISKPSAEA